tara:strand:+ start:82 stop:1281 length:1200 start_codon:yes stop_codon:yes gene_type:complete
MDKNLLARLLILKATKSEFLLARDTDAKIKQTTKDLISKIESIELKHGKDGTTPTNDELLALITPLIPKPVRGDDGETPTTEHLLELINSLIPEVKNGKDGKDYIITSEDLSEIARLVDVEVPEVEKMTPEEVRDLLETLEGEERLDISSIKGLDEKLKSISTVKTVAGGGNRLLKNLVDVETTNLDKVDGKYILGSGTIKSIVGGTNIVIDETDPANIIVTSLSDRYRTTSSSTRNISNPQTQLTFQVDTDLAYIPNQDILIDANGTNYMNAHVESYDAGTGIIVAHVAHKTGSGTYSSWDIGLDGIEAEPVDLTDYISQEFETVSKNLKSFSNALTYTGDNLTSIAYTTDTGTIIKTLNYTGDNLTSIVLSGDTPSGIDLTKTLSYVGDNLTNITYS